MSASPAARDREPIPLAIVGMGKMGHAVDELAASHGFAVVARIGRDDSAGAGGITATMLAGARVAIEFSTPDAAPANLIALARAKCATVSGTTGWQARMAEVERAVRDFGSALLWAPNFSVGVFAMARLARAAADLLRGTEFDVHLSETHHTAKRDAPSGTAKLIAAEVEAARGAPVPIASIRTGHVPGTHELIFDGPFEQLRIEHVVRDRRVFAAGALGAARWLVGRTGIFHLADVHGASEGSSK